MTSANQWSALNTTFNSINVGSVSYRWGTFSGTTYNLSLYDSSGDLAMRVEMYDPNADGTGDLLYHHSGGSGTLMSSQSFYSNGFDMVLTFNTFNDKYSVSVDGSEKVSGASFINSVDEISIAEFMAANGAATATNYFDEFLVFEQGDCCGDDVGEA